jgi:exopolysaccharide biosynthesis polyprenyl glycosylphosphotransferase
MNRATASDRPAKQISALLRPRLAISERRLLLVVADVVLVICSMLGSLLIWERLGGRSFDLALVQSQAYWLAPLAAGWLIWLALSDTYNLRLAIRSSAIVWRILAGGLFITFLYLAVFFIISRAAVTESIPTTLRLLSSGSAPLRFAPAIAVVGSTGLLLAWRLLYIWLLCGPQTRPRLLILGAGQAGRSLFSTIALHYSAQYEVVGFIDDDPRKQGGAIVGVPVLGNHRDLERIAWANHADEIALAISTRLPDAMLQTLMSCHEQGLTITPMPLIYERLTGRVAVEHIGSQWYVALPIQPRPAATALAAIKRALDIVGGLLLGLLLLLLTPLIALAIRLDSPGPILYRQERLGRHGRVFQVYKFRSMVDDAEGDGEARWAAEGDQRITRVGALLRRTRLDELPQALNVLRGEMSLVGPRPERPQFVEQLHSQIPFYRTRLAVKPGLTGWAQINYGYGGSTSDALVKLQYDLYYLKHQSPWFDLLILARTIAVVLRMQGR